MAWAVSLIPHDSRFGKRSMFAGLKPFFKRFGKVIAVWLLIAAFITVGLLSGLDKKVIAIGVVVAGLLTQAFSGLLILVGAVPLVGPLIVNIVTLPFFLLVNGIAYLVTFLAIKRGYKVDVLKTRILVSAFLVGIIVGFIVGRLI